jgi:hypothetical protein
MATKARKACRIGIGFIGFSGIFLVARQKMHAERPQIRQNLPPDNRKLVA